MVATTTARPPCDATTTWLSIRRTQGHPEAPEIERAWQFLASPQAFACPDEVLARVLGPSIAMLEDERLIVDASPTDGERTEVRHAALSILERVGGRSLGELRQEGGGELAPNAHVTTEIDEMTTVKAWRVWWQTAGRDPVGTIARVRARGHR